MQIMALSRKKKKKKYKIIIIIINGASRAVGGVPERKEKMACLSRSMNGWMDVMMIWISGYGSKGMYVCTVCMYRTGGPADRQTDRQTDKREAFCRGFLSSSTGY